MFLGDRTYSTFFSTNLMIQHLIHICASFFNDDKGATAVEYAILIAIIVIFAISGIMGAGDAQKAIWEDTSNSLQVIRPE